MKCRVFTTLLAAAFASGGSLALPTQNLDATRPQLKTRHEPAPHAPDEQLLPPSDVPTMEPPNRKRFPQKYASVYMPVSLAAGRVRTPEFPVLKHSQWYDVMLQVEKPLPFLRMKCMVGATMGPRDTDHCDRDDPILRASWTVWEQEHIVQWGSIPDDCGCIFTNENIFKLIGSFPLDAGKKYVVQVHFTSDGTPLNVASPHLIVIPHKDMWNP